MSCRLWHDLPELPQCLAAGRGLGEVAPDPLGLSSSRPTSSIGPATAVDSAKALSLGGRRSNQPRIRTIEANPEPKHHCPDRRVKACRW